jgi:hypothetical protein
VRHLLILLPSSPPSISFTTSPPSNSFFPC